MAVEGGAVVGFLDEVVVVVDGGGGDGLVLIGDTRFEGVKVGFHEPGEGFQIDEFDGGGHGWIRQEGLHAAAFLAVAGEGTLGV